MVTWKEFAAAEPDLADVGRLLLYQFKVGLAFLATVRQDGAPRLHPVCPVLSNGRLFVLITPTSPKRYDLLRDGKYALQTFLQPKPGSDEFYIAGKACWLTIRQRVPTSFETPSIWLTRRRPCSSSASIA